MNYLTFLLALVLIFSPIAVWAEALPSTPTIVISEIQTGSLDSASHEFVELYNPLDVPVDIDGWVIEYKSAASIDTSSAWIKKATLSGTIPAHGFHFSAPKTFLVLADAEWSAGLAGSGGNIRLNSPDGNIVDQVGYGDSANASETRPALAPGAGQSIERLPGWRIEDAGNATDTNNNAADFVIRETPAPQSTASNTEYLEADTGPPDNLPLIEAPVEPVVYPRVSITELLIDPQSPLTDAEDEFIELHNPSDEPAIITGYTLKAGTGFRDYYVLPETVIAAGQYLALYSRDTKLSLVNGGGSAQLLDPAGAIIDQAEVYPVAEPGLSWALTDGSWEWTLQSTPSAANVYVAPLASASSVKKETAKKATVKKAATVKPKKATAKKAAAAKSPKSAKVKAAVASKPVPPLVKNFQPANWLIALLIGLTISYAIYEFRYDIQNIYRRARGNH